MKKDWEIKKLGDCCNIQNGYAFDSKFFTTNKNDMPLIRIRDIKRGFSETYYSAEYPKEYIVHKGDFLIGMDGEFNIGEWKSEDALLNQRVCRIVCDETKLLNRYIFYFIPKELKRIEEHTTYTTVKHLSSKQISEMLLPVPPLEEQKRIVKILDEKFAQLESLKANAQTNLQNTKDLFQSQLAKAFSNTTWEKKRLFEICQNIVDCPHTTPKKSVVPTDYPCIRTSELKNGEIDWTTMQYLKKEEYLKRITRLEPKENDIVYGREGTFGDAVLLPNTHHFSLGQRTMLLRPNSDIINPKFLLKAIISPYVYKQALEKNNGCGVPHVNVADVKNFIIPVPSAEIQKRIVKELDALSEKVKALQNIYEKMLLDCEELKQSLLAKAFEGNL